MNLSFLPSVSHLYIEPHFSSSLGGLIHSSTYFSCRHYPGATKPTVPTHSLFWNLVLPLSCLRKLPFGIYHEKVFQRTQNSTFFPLCHSSPELFPPGFIPAAETKPWTHPRYRHTPLPSPPNYFWPVTTACWLSHWAHLLNPSLCSYFYYNADQGSFIESSWDNFNHFPIYCLWYCDL